MRYFTEREMLCRCGRPECDALRMIHLELAQGLDELRERLGRPIAIASALRCAFWNHHEGGRENSGHRDGTEADLVCNSSRDRYDLLEAVFTPLVLFNRLGVGPMFLHVGVSMTLPQGVAWDYYPRRPA